MAVAAILVIVNRWLHGILWPIVAPNGSSGCLAIICFAIAIVLFANRFDQNLAWGTFLVAWSFALIDSLTGIVNSFQKINGGSVKAGEMLPHYESVLSGFVIPGLLTVPVAWLVMTYRNIAFSKASCWFTAALLLAMIDVVVVVLLSVTILGVHIASDGTVEWFFGPL